MTPLEFYVIVGLGLVSSLHCVQMCGPIVLSYSLSLSANGMPARRFRADLVLAHLAYNLGRVTTYTALGAVAGLLGGSIGLVGRLAGIQNVVAIVTGGLMVVAGLVMLGLVPPRIIQRIDPLNFTSSFFKQVGRRISSTTVASKFSLGAMLGFLPCGLIYVALLKAIETATPVAGALTMLAFGLGTTSALMLVGFASSVITVRLGSWGSRVAAVGVTLLGVVLLWRGVAPFILMDGGHAAHGHH